MTALFSDRLEAGRHLATALERYAGSKHAIVLALPRGGVPVGFMVARQLHLPLDVLIVRKLGIPGHEEYAMGAIASGGAPLIDRAVVEAQGVTPAEVARVVALEQAELARRERQYRGDRPPPDVAGRTVIVVDDGLATGASMRAAVAVLRGRGPAAIVVAVPVGAREACAAMRLVADDAVCAFTPEPFHAVGIWYTDFEQTSDVEVHELLARARRVERDEG